MDDSTKDGYEIILGKYIFIDLRLNLKFSDHVIKSDYGPLKWSKASMADLGTYEFRVLNTGNVTPEELFLNFYIE